MTTTGGGGPDGTAGPVGRRDLVALGATIAVLAAWDIGRSVAVAGDLHLRFNFSMAFVIAALGAVGGLSLADVGLARDRMRAGLVYGGAVLAVVALGLLVIGLIPATSDFLRDDRVQVSTGAMLFEVLVAVPFGTVLLEELAFRGTLLGLLQRRTSTLVAVGVSSLIFGLWHIPGVVNDAQSVTGVGTAGAVAGTVAATTIAGIGFAWLRLRSGSLLAPMLAHVATNSLTFAAAWLVSR